jgi:uncharacterized protein YnzC (UPF0291/DUF896 family)
MYFDPEKTYFSIILNDGSTAIVTEKIAETIDNALRDQANRAASHTGKTVDLSWIRERFLDIIGASWNVKLSSINSIIEIGPDLEVKIKEVNKELRGNDWNED